MIGIGSYKSITRFLAFIVLPLILSGSIALACSDASFVWEPLTDTDPPYYSVLAGEKRGWIDRSGKRIRFEPERPVSDPDRLTPFQDGDFFGYSRNGRTVIPPQFLEAGEFQEGRALVTLQGPCRPAGGGLAVVPSSCRGAQCPHQFRGWIC